MAVEVRRHWLCMSVGLSTVMLLVLVVVTLVLTLLSCCCSLVKCMLGPALALRMTRCRSLMMARRCDLALMKVWFGREAI